MLYGGGAIAPYHKGFTLAEVLITLGIIGVVAAMTMPSLVANYKKKVYVTQLKKTVSTLEQGFRMALAEDGVEKLSDSSLTSFCRHIDNNNEACYINADRFLKIFNATELKSGDSWIVETLKVDEEDKAFLLANGACVVVGDMDVALDNGPYYNVAVDINCDKSPDKAGLDFFALAFDNSGALKFNDDTSSIDEMEIWLKDECKGVPKYYDGLDSFLGAFCAVYLPYFIIKDGWEMKY